MAMVVNINGRMCGEQDAVVSVFDHGFLYGDGVYEVVRTYGRRPFLFEPHQRRLRESARRIALDVPFTDEEMLARIQATIDAMPGTDEVYVRILLTRGVGDFSYDPRVCPTPTLVLIAKPNVAPASTALAKGVSLSIVDIVRNHPDSLNPLIKSNNLLNNALAMQQAIKAGAAEALMRNHRGEFVECSQSNVFLVHAGRVLTPPLEAGLLAGVTRGFVFDLGRECGIPVSEAHLYDADLSTAGEAFITSTTKEILPVVRIDDHTIGSGVPGPVTRGLMAAFRRHTTALAATAVQQA
jgi:branched-chain amino acid aminotransferase